MKEITTCKLHPIGTLEYEDRGSRLVLKEDVRRGLQGLDHFSHIRVFWMTQEGELRMATAEIDRVEDGSIRLTHRPLPEQALIFDVKPYMPSEDRVRDCTSPSGKEWFEAADASASPGYSLSGREFAVSSIGRMEQREGKTFLQLLSYEKEDFKELQEYSHINLLWYFHRLDRPHFRKMLVCKPPYEAPKSGVFASRAPVRPNPIGLTTCRIRGMDAQKGLIEVQNFDGFHATPVLAVMPYREESDRVKSFSLPSWFGHWPEWIQENDRVVRSEALKPPETDSLKWFMDAPPALAEEEEERDPASYEAFEKDPRAIHLIGARQNNLKNLTVSLPMNKMTVITGLSGSGKSSLAFDTLYAEGQRRYMQSLSAASRRAVGVLEKPEFDHISHILPSIAIQQNRLTGNPRSTVGSLSDIYTYLRLLYARWGARYCTRCGTGLSPQTTQQLAFRIIRLFETTSVGVYAGKEADEKALIHRFVLPGEEKKTRALLLEIREHIARAYEEGAGFLTLVLNGDTPLCVTDKSVCTRCRAVYFKAYPSLFSYNSPSGMCQTCKGLGIKMEVDPEKVISQPELSLLDGASAWYGDLRKHRKKPNANWFRNEVLALAEAMEVDLEIPWNRLPEDFRTIALYGSGDEEYSYTYNSGKNGRAGTITRPVGGALNHIRRLFSQSRAGNSHEVYKQFLQAVPCPDCQGERLAPEGRFVSLGGQRYPETAAMTLEEMQAWVEQLEQSFSRKEGKAASQAVSELRQRVGVLHRMGLGYLTLDRSANTLSGGESQRIKLAGQMGSGLTGILYVLDEPSIGLHHRDHARIIDAMKALRDEGNTVVVVEHDRDTMLAADHIIDLGPGAGSKGGEILAQGTPEDIMEIPDSLTAQGMGPVRAGLVHQEDTPVGEETAFLTISGARLHNLQSVSASFPLGRISCVTGVSGSGKSSLIRGTLVPAMLRKFRQMDAESGPYESLTGLDSLASVIHVDQSSIGRSPRSIPATYIGFFEEIRKVFSKTALAKEKKYKPNRFSFNDKTGRCPTCEGLGKIKVELQFLPDAWVTCQDCEGKRFNPETLSVTYQGKTIADILGMEAGEAAAFFSGHPAISNSLKMMEDVGLDYIKLGQNSATLSGGEAQRIKLAKELVKEEQGASLYVLDEPTSGLHFADVKRLLSILHRLAARGNTIIIIEHNLDVIGASHWIVDLGPDGGEKGGRVIAQGTPREVSRVKESLTGRSLAEFLP